SAPQRVYEQVVGWVEPRLLAALAHRKRWRTRWASRRDPAFDPPYQRFSYTLSDHGVVEDPATRSFDSSRTRTHDLLSSSVQKKPHNSCGDRRGKPSLIEPH